MEETKMFAEKYDNPFEDQELKPSSNVKILSSNNLRISYTFWLLSSWPVKSRWRADVSSLNDVFGFKREFIRLRMKPHKLQKKKKQKRIPEYQLYYWQFLFGFILVGKARYGWHFKIWTLALGSSLLHPMSQLLILPLIFLLWLTMIGDVVYYIYK